MVVDSHCHLEMESFDKDRDEVVARSQADGVDFILTVGTEEVYFEKVITIVDTYPQVYGALGIHPHNSKDFHGGLPERMREYVAHEKIVAFGEIGLDFFKNYSPKEAQIAAFHEQLQVASDFGLPVIIHSRNAKRETLEILSARNNGPNPGVIHCFSYDRDAARRFVDLGFFISIPGTITYRNATELAEAVRYVPMDRILAETDAPFLTPEPNRGRRNEPRFVKLTVEKIAQITHKPFEEVAQAVKTNFLRLFLGRTTEAKTA
jgi:TatD DNase family protein